MPVRNFPENVRQLVFEYIDSVEQLEVLLFMRVHRDQAYNCQAISAELRSNPQSVMNRLRTLEAEGFLRVTGDSFQYDPKDEEIDKAVAELADVYKVKPHKIFELIFSPLKKGRLFADAFVVKDAFVAKDAMRDVAKEAAKAEPLNKDEKESEDG